MTTQTLALGGEQARENILRAHDRFRVQDARRKGRRWLVLLLLVGPGVLTMLGENDGPSMLSYITTGSLYGLHFFVPLVLLTFVMAYVIQEATIRIGIATQQGHAELIFSRFGHGWGYFAVLDLAFCNILTLVAEFVAICSGARFLGVPPLIAVIASFAVIVGAFAVRRYVTWERVALALAAFNLIFIPIAFAACRHPQPIAALTFAPAHGHSLDATMLMMILANVGATVTPWMVFFQQSAVVDKGLTHSDLWHARVDTAIGAVLAAIVAIAAIFTGSALLTHSTPATMLQGSIGFADALVPAIGKHLTTLFALGMIEAGLTAAVTISASTAYASAEVLGRPKSLNGGLREGAVLYGVVCVSLLLAAVLALWPHAPLLKIALFANVVATMFMAPVLLFLMLILNDKQLMGSLVNRRTGNLACGAVILLVCGLGVGYSAMVLLPQLFPR